MSRVFHEVANEDPNNVFTVTVVDKNFQNAEDQKSLLRERHVNSLITHRTIVQTVDMFSSTKHDYLVFELMDGGSLSILLSRHNKLPESYARVVIRELFTALKYIHKLNIVRRDVRPKHIFCSAKKFPMAIALENFGMASFVPENRVSNGVLSSMLGISPYIAVDILRRVKYGPISDISTAGVVLFQMLSGELPFTGSTDREVAAQINYGAVRMESDAWNTVSPEANGLVRQLLHIDPSERISALGRYDIAG